VLPLEVTANEAYSTAMHVHHLQHEAASQVHLPVAMLACASARSLMFLTPSNSSWSDLTSFVC
jgi:hypothetical protein